MWKATISFVMSVRPFRPNGTTRLPLDGFSWNLIFWVFFENLSRKFKFHWNLTRITGSLHEDLCRLWYLVKFFLEWEMFQTHVVEKIKTHFMFNNCFFRKSCNLWDNVEKYGTVRQATDDSIIRRMCFACCINKVTGTHWEYVILFFHGNNGYANALQCYVIRTLPVLFCYIQCLFSLRHTAKRL